MTELGKNKNSLLEQVKQKEIREVAAGSMTQDGFVTLLEQLLDHYSDLRKEDYKDWVSEEVYQKLMDALRDPEESGLWDNINAMPEGNEAENQNKLRSVLDYIVRYPNGPKIVEANLMKEQLNRKLDEIREASDWGMLNKENYESMLNYRSKYPNSAHMIELDDNMWSVTDDTSKIELQRYCEDWKDGRHVDEAQKMLDVIGICEGGDGDTWEELAVVRLKRFITNNPNFPFIDRVKEQYEAKRNAVLSDMRIHPEKCGRSELDMYIKSGILTREELVAAGIIPPQDSNFNPDILPNLEQFSANPNYEAKEGSTDIYLFGVPGTGKTCLLMGLTGAAGRGYTINFREKGGPYASALQQYVQAGVTPESTPGKYVTTIRSVIEEIHKSGQKNVVLNHHVNFVEMSGEEFAHKIANNPDDNSIKFTDMGDGTKQLLRNSNRKVFFIIIDPTVENIKFTFKKYEKDENGNVIGIRPVTEYINQLACINKFVNLFEADENKEFMKRVDAIHFIVTKADTFGDDDERRKEQARDLMMNKYENPVRELIGYCRRTKRVNYATDFCPMVYPFSLGRFYVGGSFTYNNKSTLNIINVIRYNTAATKEDSFMDKLRDFLA